MTIKMLQLCLIIVAFAVYVTALFLGYANSAENKDIFYSKISDLDAKYFQQVTPTATTFAILWLIVYLWNLLAICYIFISTFLQPKRSPVNIEPTLIPIPFLLGYICAYAGSIAWFFFFDRELLKVSFGVLFITIGAYYSILIVSYKRVYDNLVFLDKEDTQVMLWLVRGLIQNGLSLPATMLTYSMFLNLADVIIYDDSFGKEEAHLRDEISVEGSSTMVLSILLIIFIIWFSIENFFLEAYCRYTFTVFPLCIFLVSGGVSKLRDMDAGANFALASVTLTFCVFAFVCRVLLFFHRRKLRIAAEAIV